MEREPTETGSDRRQIMATIALAGNDSSIQNKRGVIPTLGVQSSLPKQPNSRILLTVLGRAWLPDPFLRKFPFRSARDASRTPVPFFCLVRSVWRRPDPCQCEGASAPAALPRVSGKRSSAPAAALPSPSGRGDGGEGLPAPSGSGDGGEGEQKMATPSPSRFYQRSARDRCCPSNRSSARSRHILRTAAALTRRPDP